MHIDSYVQALREDLARVAAVGDESTGRAAELLTVALESAVGRRLQEALAEAALELSPQLDEGRVEVRVAGGDPELIYVRDIPSAPATPTEPADESTSARITLRLSETLKTRLEVAAGASGQSLNSWLVQTLHHALESPRSSGAGRHRLSGHGRA